jgi:hypothetical protein
MVSKDASQTTKTSDKSGLFALLLFLCAAGAFFGPICAILGRDSEGRVILGWCVFALSLAASLMFALRMRNMRISGRKAWSCIMIPALLAAAATAPNFIRNGPFDTFAVDTLQKVADAYGDIGILTATNAPFSGAKAVKAANGKMQYRFEQREYIFTLEILPGNGRSGAAFSCTAVHKGGPVPLANYYIDNTRVLRATTNGSIPNASSPPAASSVPSQVAQ